MDRFAPKAAIATGQGPHATVEPRAVRAAQLRELPIIFILIFGMAFFWRNLVLTGLHSRDRSP